MIQSLKIIGTGLATIGFIGTGVGICIIFAALTLAILISGLINYLDICEDPMPGVKCPTCAENGIEQWVLPGKHCPRCSTACRH